MKIAMHKRTGAEQMVYDVVKAVLRKSPGVWFAPADSFAFKARERAIFLRMLARGDFHNDCLEADASAGKVRYRTSTEPVGQLTLAGVLK